MKRIPRRLLTEEFKREAIKLVTEQNLNVAQAGRQLDSDPKSIRAWIAQAERAVLKATLGATKLTADQQRHLHPIFKLCDLLDVARSGYQAWVGGKVIPARKLEDLRLTVAIKAAHARGRGIYGPLKIQTELAAQGVIAGINRI